MLSKKVRGFLILMASGSILIGCMDRASSAFALQETYKDDKAESEENEHTDIEKDGRITTQEGLSFPLGQEIKNPDENVNNDIQGFPHLRQE